MPQRVSLCMIAKNEEANLPACLTSVKDLVQEMIVVDTGSTDRTREVAAACGARAFDFTWIDSFAAARNESLRPATGDWILWLDGDEHFDDDNRGKLGRLFAGLKGEKAAYVMKQRSAPEHAGNSDTLVDQVRLFRNRPEIRWRYRVHEQILPAIRAAGHEVRFTDICLEHTGYTDAALLDRKTERNLRLLQLQEADDPDDPFTLFNLGWVYQDLGQAPKAIPYLRRSLALSQPGDSIVRKLYVLLAQAHRTLGQQRPALAACRAGRAHCPDDPELLFLEAQILREHGDPAGAEKCLRHLLQLRPGTHFASLDAGVRGVKARYQLAWACWEQGRASEAEEAWKAVLAEQARFTPAWQGLGELYLAQGRWGELEDATERLCADSGHALDGVLLRARGHLARKELDPARQLLEEVIAQNPRALAPRVFLSHVLLQSEDWAAAELALGDVLELDPRQAETWRNLAVLLNSQRRFEEAVEACKGGLLQCPGEPNLLRLQQIILHQQAAVKDTNGKLFHHAANGHLRLAFASFSPFAFTTDTPYQEPLGGSESALCYLAEALSQQGHEVFLLNQGKVPVVCRGVHCLPLSEASGRHLGPLDAFIVQNFAGKGSELRTLLSPDTPLVFWSQHAHDQPGVQALHDPAECQAYDLIVMVSDWQRQQFIQHFGLDPEQTVVLRNAISPAFSALFADNTPILAQKAKPPVLAYTSTPFRGLDLLLDAFPLIRRAVPEVVLKVFSSMQVYHVPEAEEARYGDLYRKCRETEGMEYIGSLPQPELAGQLRLASLLAYPNTFAETSCIAVLEAMASGCLVVTSDLAALPETTAGFARLVPTAGGREAFRDHFVEATVDALRMLAESTAPEAESHLRRQVAQTNENHSWSVRAGDWVQCLSRLVEKHHHSVVQSTKVTVDGGWSEVAQARRQRLVKTVLEKTGGIVTEGPFKGMQIAPEASWADGDLAAKLLGFYEEELHPAVLDAIERAYSAVVIIGCAEGYYAVAFALHMEKSRVIAFDKSEKARRICRENAERNQVGSRIDIRAECTTQALRDCLSEVGRCFLLIDCEGAELELLDPAVIPEIAECDFIVECHDFMNPCITGEIVRRFVTTHEIVKLREGPRDPNTDPILRQMPGLDRWLTISENRPECMHWLVCRKHAGVSSDSSP